MNFQIKMSCSLQALSSYLSPVDFGIDKSIFIKPKTFHLTVLMLKLWNKDRIAKASDVLQVL
jgi:activating signal cointegrator complex subunit 1